MVPWWQSLIRSIQTWYSLVGKNNNGWSSSRQQQRSTLELSQSISLLTGHPSRSSSTLSMVLASGKHYSFFLVRRLHPLLYYFRNFCWQCALHRISILIPKTTSIDCQWELCNNQYTLTRTHGESDIEALARTFIPYPRAICGRVY